MAAGERGTQRQNREDGKRPRPISQAAFQVDELRQFGVANIRHLPRLTLDHPALTVRVDRKNIRRRRPYEIQGALWCSARASAVPACMHTVEVTRREGLDMTKWRQTDPGGYVMVVTIEESIVIYARASRKWFGARARDKTQERIEQLAQAGDWEGASLSLKTTSV
jgi:hypothetical protein